MGARDRFEHTEPWGFTPEGSGVRTRPDLSTALLPPMIAPEPRPQTQPLTRPLRAFTRPPVAAPSTPPPAAAPSTPPPAPDAPLQAAVHASVYASVQAMLLAASQLPRTSVVPPAPAPAPVVVGWTPAQRIYVLATAVALSVMATTIVFLTLGSSDVHGSRAPRTARISAVAVATLDTSSVGSAARKDPSIVVAVAEGPVAQVAARRAPSSVSPVRTASSGALSSTAGGGTSSRSAAKLDDAARSAKMLREQLNTAVN